MRRDVTRWLLFARRALAPTLVLVLCVGSASAARDDSFEPPAFTRFGWISPPVESTTDAHVAEMAAAGLTLMLPVQNDSGHTADNLRRMDLAAAHGMRCLVFDERLLAFLRWSVDSPEGRARLDSIAADYRDHPGFFGYYLGDEPLPPWRLLHDLGVALRARDPGHPVWNDLLGRGSWPDTASWLGYTRSYLDSVPVRVLCADDYEFRTSGDLGGYFEHAAGLRATAAARGIPFWSVVLLVEHRGYRAVTPGMLRWQVANLLAYGCRGVGYFSWWTPAPDTLYDWHDAVIRVDGTHTPTYDVVVALDRDAGAVGTRLAAMRWVSTQCTMPLPRGADAFRGDDWLARLDPHATVGRFVDANGDPHLLIVNRDSLAGRTIHLAVRAVAEVSSLDPVTDTWSVVRLAPPDADGLRALSLDLAAGDFALLRLGGTRGEAVERVGPRLASLVTPARGVARLALAHLDAGATLLLVDASGRRVRIWHPPPGDGEIEWDGHDAQGRRVMPGVFFARVRDARGESHARLVWLGP